MLSGDDSIVAGKISIQLGLAASRQISWSPKDLAREAGRNSERKPHMVGTAAAKGYEPLVFDSQIVTTTTYFQGVDLPSSPILFYCS